MPPTQTPDWSCLQQRLEMLGGRPPSAIWQASRHHSRLYYVREDLIGGYKARKFSSLRPWISSQMPQWVRLRGSSHSSFILELALWLNAQGIAYRYTLEGREGPPMGFGLLNRLVLGERFVQDGPSPQTRVDGLQSIESSGCLDLTGQASPEAGPLEIPEGGNCPASLPGCLALGYSLAWEMLERRWWPSLIYVDSGTGFTAAALVLSLAQLNLHIKTVVVSMTGQSTTDFDRLVDQLRPHLSVPIVGEPHYEVRSPVTGKSFGSVNKQVWLEIERLAQQEGLLVDPIYSAKLSLTYEQARPADNTLLLVGGGARELLCFQQLLAQHQRSRSANPEPKPKNWPNRSNHHR